MTRFVQVGTVTFDIKIENNKMTFDKILFEFLSNSETGLHVNMQ